MAQTVVGFFDDAAEARRAVEQLTQQGVSRESIDVRENTMDSTNTVSHGRDSDDNGITRFFKNLFGADDDEADRYSRVGSASQTIVTVHARTEDEAERAADVLDSCGAIDVDERASRYSNSASDRRVADTDKSATIQRVEESLNVDKRTEERGGLRVRSRIVERPVEEHVRLREEHINVERQPVNRPLSSDDSQAFQDRDIELTERTEVPIVNKEAWVVEEIRISKDVNQRDETVRDTVRNTEIDVDKTDGSQGYRQDDLRR